MPHLSEALTISLEGIINGRVSRELEYTFYAKLTDLKQLDNAAEKEDHEQWRLPLATERPVKARLRLINGRRHTMTTKVRRGSQPGFDEVDSDIPQDLFNHLREAAVDGYKKVRYNFPIPGTNRKWEIDVFMDQTGNPHPWVKIDYEVESVGEKPPLEFPVDVSEYILESDSTNSADRRFIRSLWDNQWAKIDPTMV